MSDVFSARRARVAAALGADAALVLCAAPELRVGPDTHLRYIPDADFFYLTGYDEPEAVLVLCPAAEHPYTLFVRPRDEERERWSGVRGGVEAARERFGADAAHPLADLPAELPKLIGNVAVLHARPETGRTDFDAALRAVLVASRRDRPRTGSGVHSLTDSRVLLGPLRQRKDEHEIEQIRAAADVTVAAFEDAARALGTAAGEWQIEAALEHGMRHRGAQGSAFPSIVAGGGNAAVLHYIANSDALRAGELVLVDAGARCGMYCADISRTWPVGGRFDAAQRELYDLVRAAHGAAVAAAAPGAPAGALHEAALHVLVDGMRQLGLLHGSRDEIIERQTYRRYYPHRTSHWLGLDVHDVGDYVHDDGRPVLLEAGMVLTVEPGLYVPPDDTAAPASLRGMGVRLEDDVLMHDDGCELLTGALPIDADAVERLVG